MAGARDVARVLDSRVRRMLDGIQPEPSGRWIDRVPRTGSADLDRYLRELAEAMDDRTRRLGEHTAATQPAWACQALGPVPDEPVGRLEWEQRASVVAAYRERYGYAHPADPVGPEPAKTSPEARAAWHAALAALGRVEGAELRGCSDGELWLRRSTYERETAWAPPHVAEELRLMRTAERDAHVNAVRADYESRAARDEETAERHRRLAGIWRALETKAAAEAAIFAAVQQTRRQWETVTETTRTIALAADRELRRRYPGVQIEPLRPHPAEAAALTYPAHPGEGPEDATWVQAELHGAEQPAMEAGRQTQQTEPVVSSRREADGRRLLGLTVQAAQEEIPEQVLRIRENARIAQAKLDDLTHLPVPGTREDDMSPGLAWPACAGRDRDAVLQPPQPRSYLPPGSWSIITLRKGHLRMPRPNGADESAMPASPPAAPYAGPALPEVRSAKVTDPEVAAKLVKSGPFS